MRAAGSCRSATPPRRGSGWSCRTRSPRRRARRGPGTDSRGGRDSRPRRPVTVLVTATHSMLRWRGRRSGSTRHEARGNLIFVSSSPEATRRLASRATARSMPAIRRSWDGESTFPRTTRWSRISRLRSAAWAAFSIADCSERVRSFSSPIAPPITSAAGMPTTSRATKMPRIRRYGGGLGSTPRGGVHRFSQKRRVSHHFGPLTSPTGSFSCRRPSCRRCRGGRTCRRSSRSSPAWPG